MLGAEGRGKERAWSLQSQLREQGTRSLMKMKSPGQGHRLVGDVCCDPALPCDPGGSPLGSQRPVCSFQGCGHIYPTVLTGFKNLLLHKNQEPNTGEVASAGEVAGPSEETGRVVQSLGGTCVQQRPQQGTGRHRTGSVRRRVFVT